VIFSGSFSDFFGREDATFAVSRINQNGIDQHHWERAFVAARKARIAPIDRAGIL